MNRFDLTIIGAGAAGLFCAGIAGQLGLSVLLLDHSEKVAEKIRISGGGRCNFTNRELDLKAPQACFLSQNPDFCRSALSRYTPDDFIALLSRHGVAFHEKHKGQMFCDGSAQDVISVLLAECATGHVTRWQPCSIKSLEFYDSSARQDKRLSYRIDSDRGIVDTRAVVIATGGLSLPKAGASDFGLRVARRFGLRVVEPRPALVPFTCSGSEWSPFAGLAGLALPVKISTGSGKASAGFLEDLLFTHRGLSGPAALQISSYWQPGTPLLIDLAPRLELSERLSQLKATSRKSLPNDLAAWFPSRLAETWTQREAAWRRRTGETPQKVLDALAASLHGWCIEPDGTEGWRKAEVTLGGVDTRDLSSRTMESGQQGLYFIGEVVDVTGWLGGYNFQWAWASAHACAMACAGSLLAAR